MTNARGRKLRRSSAGFTLIELMIVVAIIGILASVAVPAFSGFLGRTKRSERNILLTNLRRSAESTLSDRGRFESGDVSNSSSYASFNPPLPAVGGKRPWDTTIPGWQYLGFKPQGNLRYSYYFYGISQPGFQFYEIITESDVNDDGVIEFHEEDWQILPGYDGFQRTYLYDYPPEQ